MTIVTQDAMETIFQALNAEDDMVEDSSSSLPVNPAKSVQNRDVPSVEDVAWADSCFVSDVENSDPNWSSLLDALAETTLSSRSSAPASSASERYALTGEVDIAVAPTRFDCVETPAFDSASIPDKNKLEKNSDKHPIDDQSDASPLESTYENIFLPTYKEDTTEIDHFVAEFEAEFPVYAIEQSNESIFKEWDIHIPEEEDELTKQLDKLLSGDSTSQADPSSNNDTGVWEASRGQSIDDPDTGYIDLSIDDLISGVSDLSLNGYSAS